MKRTVLYLLMASLLAVAGCWGRVEFPQAVVVGGVGVDRLADGRIMTSFQLLLPPGSDKTPSFSIVSQSGLTVSAGYRKMSLESPKSQIIDHIAAVVIGEAMVKNLTDMVDLLIRNPHFRQNTDVFVAQRARARQVFEVAPFVEQSSAQALKSMIKWQDPTTGIYTRVDVTEVLSKLVAPGIEPVVPGVELASNRSGKTVVRLFGTAVFKKGHLVGWLDTRESRGYRWLRPRQVRGGTLTVACPLDGQPVVLEMLRAKSDISPYFQNGKLKFKIKVKDDAEFCEQSCEHNLLTPQMIERLEMESEQQIRTEILAAVRKAQTLGSDIFGLGLTLSRKHPDEWQSLERNWETVFPTVPVSVEVDLKIRRSGLLTRILF